MPQWQGFRVFMETSIDKSHLIVGADEPEPRNSEARNSESRNLENPSATPHKECAHELEPPVVKLVKEILESDKIELR